MRIGSTILCFVLVACAAARASTVKTLDGKSYEGEVRFSASGKLAIVPKSGDAAEIDFKSLLSVQFKGQPSARAAMLPHWVGRDIGIVPPMPQGDEHYLQGVMTIRASGIEMRGDRDSFHFVYQPFAGDVELVARVASITRTDEHATAGLMIRGGADVNAFYAMTLAQAGARPCMRLRARPMQMLTAVSTVDPGAPVWLKLIRQGNSVRGYTSLDGQDWDLIGSETVQLPPTALIGFAVCANNAHGLCTAVFEKISIASIAAPTATENNNRALRGVVLRDGSIVVGQVRSASDSVVRIYRDREREMSIPINDISRVLLGPLPRNFAGKFQPGHRGVLLYTGDFFEGELMGIEGGRVKVSSVLFGVKKFEMPQVLAIALRDLTAPAGAFEVSAADGSVLAAEKLEIEKDTMVAQTKAGAIRFAIGELIEIKAGASRFKALAEIKPAAVKNEMGMGAEAAFVAEAGGADKAVTLGGKPSQMAMILSAGTSVTYRFDGAYRMAMFRLGMKDEIAAPGAARLTVIADDREIYKSDPRTAQDEAVSISLNLEGVKSLVLRADAAGKIRPTGRLVLTEAALVQ
jgi:hypothetical protein